MRTAVLVIYAIIMSPLIATGFLITMIVNALAMGSLWALRVIEWMTD